MKKEFDKETIHKNISRLAKCFPHLAKYPFTYKGKLYERKIETNILKDIANNYDKLAYPYHPNWSYCIPILPAYEHKGKIVDIGLHLYDDLIIEGKYGILNCISNNIVSSNDPPDYGSNAPGINNVYSKRLMLELYKMKILTKEHLIYALDFNNLLLKFYESDLTGFDLERALNKYVNPSTDNLG